MQKSDELADVATLYFVQVSNLGIKTWTTGFNIWSDDNNFYTDYITNPQGGFIEPYTVDVTKAAVFSKMSEAKKEGSNSLVNYEEGEESGGNVTGNSPKREKKQFSSLLESGFSVSGQNNMNMLFSGSIVSLLFITYEPIPEGM